MIALLFVFSLLDAQPIQTERAIVRVVADPRAPIALVGDACTANDSDRAQARANVQDPSAALNGYAISRWFQCEGDCQIAFRAGQNAVTSFRIGHLQLGDRGRWYQGLLPEMPATSSTSCHGDMVKVITMEFGLPIQRHIVYVAEVRFANGSVWTFPNHDAFVRQVSREWRQSFKRSGGR